jgi:predicted nucleotidyltransferase
MTARSENLTADICKTALEIPDSIKNYFNVLVSEFEQIREIWLLGSRANKLVHKDSDWDILVFANSKVLTQLRQNERFNQSSKYLNIDLLVLHDDNHFEAPWTSPDRTGKERIKKDTLSNWKFKIDKADINLAHYKGTHDPTLHKEFSQNYMAYKIWRREEGWLT